MTAAHQSETEDRFLLLRFLANIEIPETITNHVYITNLQSPISRLRDLRSNRSQLQQHLSASLLPLSMSEYHNQQLRDQHNLDSPVWHINLACVGSKRRLYLATRENKTYLRTHYRWSDWLCTDICSVRPIHHLYQRGVLESKVAPFQLNDKVKILESKWQGSKPLDQDTINTFKECLLSNLCRLSSRARGEEYTQKSSSFYYCRSAVYHNLSSLDHFSEDSYNIFFYS